MTQQYLERGTVFPSEEVQARYPLAEFPCSVCARDGLPHLVDNPAEFYWEHHKPKRGRSLCTRFTGSMNRARKGTAEPAFYMSELL